MKKLSSRGISHMIIPVAVFLLLGAVGGTYMLAKSRAASTVHLCLSYNYHYCIVTHGSYNQATVATSGYSNFRVLAGGTHNGYSVLMFQVDSTGNCLKATDTTNVTVGTDGCSTSRPNDRWEVHSYSPLRLKSVGVGSGSCCYMGTFSIFSGDGVRVANPQNNFFSGWVEN